MPHGVVRNSGCPTYLLILFIFGMWREVHEEAPSPASPSYLVSAYTDNSPSLQWRAPLWFSSHYLEGGHALNTLSVINTFPWNTFIKLVLTENWDPWRNRLEAQSSLRWQNFVYSNSLLFDTWFLDHQRYLAWVHSPANQSPYNW